MTAAIVPINAAPDEERRESAWPHRLRDFRLISLAVVTALILSALIIAVSDLDKLKHGDVLGMLTNVKDSYIALFQGAFVGVRAWSETMTYATPLIFAGLSVAVGFKAGLFNIGATGQLFAGGMASVWVGFALHMPALPHVVLALAAGALAGALWGGLVGVLKARTGAHEVITTIMLNYIAGFAVLWMLKTTAFQAPGRSDAVSKDVDKSARLPLLFGFLHRSAFELRAHAGFLIAIACAVFLWWLMTKSKLGFQFRTLGANADAARYAGMNPARLTIGVMMIAGAFSGIGGGSEILGGITQGHATSAFAGNIGFDAIAVALLGRSSPWGTTAAALLFGALQAGGQNMEAQVKVPIDLVFVIRALIVLFVAAPALTRMIWRLKDKDGNEGAQLFHGWGS
ncbi:MAG TPA: ABC transporter permease [Ilumatobacteraceae bacterium]